MNLQSFVLNFLIDMANSATASAKITVNPNVQVKYIESSTRSGFTVTPTEGTEQGSLLVPGNQEKVQEEIQVTPTLVVTPPPATPISLDWINPRVIGVVFGLLFLWVYVKGLRGKRN
jgi:hypothetical protein